MAMMMQRFYKAG